MHQISVLARARKAELHVHLEGTVGPEIVLKLAARNGLDYPFKTVKDVEDALNNRTVGLVSFLDLHYRARASSWYSLNVF